MTHVWNITYTPPIEDETPLMFHGLGETLAEALDAVKRQVEYAIFAKSEELGTAQFALEFLNDHRKVV